jgi:hypothetical protein
MLIQPESSFTIYRLFQLLKSVMLNEPGNINP